MAVVEPDSTRRDALCAAGAEQVFESLDAGLSWEPRIAVIASPTYLHVEHSLAAARRGCDLLIEKPLSHSAESLRDLESEVKARNLITLVGCNMRFHPGPAKVKQTLDSGSLGRPLFARLHACSYLPEWRPETDFRSSYSARLDMGGGAILDYIHEIDLARWFLGEIEEVTCLAGGSSLGISAEETAMIVCRHASGVLSSICLSYAQRDYDRGCVIACEEGTVAWSHTSGTVESRDRSGGRRSWNQPAEWELNQMYLDEARYFMDCVEKQEWTILPVAEGIRVLAAALAAKESARTGMHSLAATMIP